MPRRQNPYPSGSLWGGFAMTLRKGLRSMTIVPDLRKINIRRKK